MKNRTTGTTYYWFRVFELNFTDLLDPLGWGVLNVSKAYTEEITENEFIRRLRVSRVDDKIKYFLKNYKKLWRVKNETDEIKR